MNKIKYYNMTNTLIVIIILLIVLVVILSTLFFIKFQEEECDIEEDKEEKNEVKEYKVHISGEKEVYNISPNVFTYNEAEAICKAQNPPATLASLRQIEKAYKKGANWCNYGWSKDQLALYPNQEDLDKNCGKPGVNGGYFSNKRRRFGVNCYGVKRPPNEYEIIEEDEEEEEYDVEMNDKYKINPFNKEKWSGVKE